MRKKYIFAIIFTLILLGMIFFLISSFTSTGERIVDLCQNIASDEEKKLCQSLGYDIWVGDIKSKSIDSKDSSVCDRIPLSDDRDLCFLEIIRVLPQAKVCDAIKASSRKEDCTARLISSENNFSKCREIRESVDRLFCFIRVIGNSKGGEKLCPTLVGEDQNLCWEIFYTGEAQRAEDKSICSKILDEKGKERCIEKVL